MWGSKALIYNWISENETQNQKVIETKANSKEKYKEHDLEPDEY